MFAGHEQEQQVCRVPQGGAGPSGRSHTAAHDDDTARGWVDNAIRQEMTITEILGGLRDMISTPKCSAEKAQKDELDRLLLFPELRGALSEETLETVYDILCGFASQTTRLSPIIMRIRAPDKWSSIASANAAK